MKEISKQNLLSIIQESYLEMDEMAFDDQLRGTRAIRGKGPKAEKLGSKPAAHKPIPHYFDEPKRQSFYVKNPYQVEGEQIGVHLLYNKTKEEVINDPKYQEWLENEVHPYLGPDRPIYFITVQELGFKKPGIPEHFFLGPPVDKKGESVRWQKYKEITGQDFLSLDREKGVQSSREKLLRDFRKPVTSILVNDSINKKMILSGFAPLDFPTQDPGHQKRNIDRYSEKENESFQFTSFNILPFRDFSKFAQNADKLLDLNGVPFDEADITPLGIKPEGMARQFNTIRANWARQRKNAKMDLSFAKDPFTPIHKNERGGYKVEDQDYLLTTWLTITGKLYVNDDTGLQKYVWTVEIKTEIGEKFREDEYGPINPDKNFFASVETVERKDKPELTYDPNGSILKNVRVYQALEQALKKVSNDIQSYNPIPDLEDRIFKTMSATTKKVKLDESRINSIVDDIISRLKK
jgi:hypothetical protein